ncbi:hypothetical protein [Sphingobacterium alkalisoli]|uniref:hypothetical protein n=2 Tax=Sphingobacterium alkalisoli TaxID=1874115 RepID=UPI001B80AE0F|nr:hypothetical protein [Sphingobacterium alkalisoli]
MIAIVESLSDSSMTRRKIAILTRPKLIENHWHSFLNIFMEEKLHRDTVVAKNATTAQDGKTYEVEY